MERAELKKKIKQEELQEEELKNKINQIDTRGFKILTTISVVGTFVVIAFFFFLVFSTRLSDINISATLSLATGAFAAYLVLIISGIVREFTFKAAFVEVSSKLEEKIQDVQSNVNETKEEVKEEIRELTQNIQTMNIANRFAANVSPKIQVQVGELLKTYDSIDDKRSKKLSQIGIEEKLDLEKNIELKDEDKREINYLTELKQKVGNVIEDVTNKPPPFDIPKSLKEANYFYYQKQYEKANKIYEQILEIDPTNFLALHGSGVSLLRLNENEKAYENLEQARKISPADPIVLTNVGVVLIRLGRYDDAVVHLKEAQRIAGDRHLVYYNMACAYSLMKNTQEALNNLGKAISMDAKTKERAKRDSDLDYIKQNASEEFNRLVSG